MTLDFMIPHSNRLYLMIGCDRKILFGVLLQIVE